MALEIRATPTLEGKHADRLVKIMEESKKNRKPLSKEIKKQTKAILAKAKI